MHWSRKKNSFLNVVATRLRSFSSSRIKADNSYMLFDSQFRIPIVINKINVTQASTQTTSLYANNNAEELRLTSIAHHRAYRKKYRRRFNKCLAELLEKYPPMPAHEYQQEDKRRDEDFRRSRSSSNAHLVDSTTNSSIWSKLLKSRDDLSTLNKTLEDLDHRLKRLAIDLTAKYPDGYIC